MLEAAVRAAWAANTSADPRWTPSQPALGQCAVTALVVQDHLGGKLLRGVVGGVSHYWNELPQCEVDLTREQFELFSPSSVSERDRAYVLSFPDTALRYEALKKRVCERLNATTLESLVHLT